jgi:50S ribosomal protein L16 3-hydroxylase
MRNRILAGLTSRRFLARYWQKAPLLIRQAIPEFEGPLIRSDVLRLAASDQLESRLVTRAGGRWGLQQSPLPRRTFARLPPRNWTVLVQGINHANAEADALLRHFDFIPHARLDDVMVSYAVPGGGVGPHVDSYDVFLLQGRGRRRWRISMQQDLALRPGLPLAILRNFRPEHEWVLEPGDMLYLPPGCSHDGVALTECFTYSIGFRAATHQELGEHFLDHLRDSLSLPGRIADPDLRPTASPGRLPTAMVAQAAAALRGVRWNHQKIRSFLACYLTEPKPHVVFHAPQRPLGTRRYAAALRESGIVLDRCSLMLYTVDRCYLNGEPVDPPQGRTAGLHLLKRLADRRRLGPVGETIPAPLLALLYSWYLCGFVHPDGATPP